VNGYVDVGGIHTYYEAVGDGPPLLLLHGGLMSGADYPDQVVALSDRFRVVAPDRRGHGHTADVEGPITYELMAADTIAFMDALGIDRAHVVGHSDGANIGMLLGIQHPERVDRLVLISGNFHLDCYRPGVLDWLATSPDADWTDEEAGWRRFTPDLPEHWPIFLAKVRHMFLTEPTMTDADLARITAPTLVIGADRDLITLEHFAAQFRAIPGAQLAIVPGTSHFLTRERPDLVNELIVGFLPEA
jgi:pimeloyl-ACP methyl ester carboxylesterase